MSHDHDDYQTEPVLGLPERLPPGEHILWQGAPDWRALAKDVFHVRAVGLYFALLMSWRAMTAIQDGHGLRAALAASLAVLPIAALGLGLLVLLAVLYSRTTVYTITNRRIVMRIGIAITLAINIPFSIMGAAALRRGAGGFGDIALSLPASERMKYAILWPHVRQTSFRHPAPQLRAIPDVARVAALLGAAVQAALPEVALAAPVHDAPATAVSGGRQIPLGLSASLG